MDKKIYKPGIVGIPHMGTFPHQTTLSILNLNTYNLFNNIPTKFEFVGNSLVYDAREAMVKKLMDDERLDWIFFMDSDMTVPPQIIHQFLHYDYPIVSAMAFKRTPPHQPCFYTKVELKDEKPVLESPLEWGKGLLKVEGVGTACVLIKKEVFKKLKAPYFLPKPGLGEDLTFCLAVKEAGIPIYVDTTTGTGHVTSVEIKEENFKSEYEKWKSLNNPNIPFFI